MDPLHSAYKTLPIASLRDRMAKGSTQTDPVYSAYETLPIASLRDRLVKIPVVTRTQDM